MRILVACEFSGVVRDAFLAGGHDAISCDLEPSEKPGPHYQGDVKDILAGPWDMMIAFPPCRYLAASGARYWTIRKQEQLEALEFVRFLMAAKVPKIAIENPRGAINTHIKKPDQVINPYQFGHDVRKRTCLRLRGLPPLMCTCICANPGEWVLKAPHDEKRSSYRSRTFPGIAAAMASQWGGVL